MEKLAAREGSRIKNVIAVMSGKGGVGKSSISALLAVELARGNKKVGLLDADITGPSIPKLLGLHDNLLHGEEGIIPAETKLGIKVISLNLLLSKDDDPVIWRGPLIGGAVRQFWTDVAWGELDYLVVDLPPGTGDAPLTVLQQLPVTGVVMVTSPQELANLVVRKAVKMVQLLNVPLLGLVENMAYAICPHCQEKWELFGPSQGEEAAKQVNLPFLGSLALDPALTQLGDAGKLEEYQTLELTTSVEKIRDQLATLGVR